MYVGVYMRLYTLASLQFLNSMSVLQNTLSFLLLLVVLVHLSALKNIIDSNLESRLLIIFLSAY